jgi:26S proteasome regulatory subunit N5
MIITEFYISSISLDISRLQNFIAICKALAAQELNYGVNAGLAVEQVVRYGDKGHNSRLCCCALLDMCQSAKSWTLLGDQITFLCSRKRQSKQVIVALVKQAISYLNHITYLPATIEFIETLRTVTKGKIFVETDHTRVTRQLARIYEGHGKLSEETEIIGELMTRSFCAISKTEKIFLLLEMFRLCLEKGNLVEAATVSQKISLPISRLKDQHQVSILENTMDATDISVPMITELQLKYYRLMIRYHKQTNDYLKMCQWYKTIYESESIRRGENHCLPIIKKICWLLALSPSSIETHTLLHHVSSSRWILSVPLYHGLLQISEGRDLLQFSVLLEKYGKALRDQPDLFFGKLWPYILVKL